MVYLTMDSSSSSEVDEVVARDGTPVVDDERYYTIQGGLFATDAALIHSYLRDRQASVPMKDGSARIPFLLDVDHAQTVSLPERIDGPTVWQRLAAIHKAAAARAGVVGKLTLAQYREHCEEAMTRECERILLAVCRFLIRLNSHGSNEFCHNDLHLENIVLDSHDDDRPVIIDFEDAGVFQRYGRIGKYDYNPTVDTMGSAMSWRSSMSIPVRRRWSPWVLSMRLMKSLARSIVASSVCRRSAG
jgi:hypothetical protein